MLGLGSLGHFALISFNRRSVASRSRGCAERDEEKGGTKPIQKASSHAPDLKLTPCPGSWQIRPLLDPVIPQDEFKFEADRAHSHVIELNSSHAIPITFSEVVVDVIGQAARATTKSQRYS
jgi:hypothetical protein